MEYCVCGHSKKVHTPEIWTTKSFDVSQYMQEACYYGVNTLNICTCTKFKLDNLKLIEDLAKERNLI